MQFFANYQQHSLLDRGAFMNNCRLLDRWHHQFLQEQHKVHEIMDDIVIQLNAIRLRSTDNEWKEFVQICLSHPLSKVLQEDPFTDRAYKKPRGYAGDAVMMDLIYTGGGLIEQQFDHTLTPKGQEIMLYSLSRSSSKSVCARLNILVEILNQTITQKNNARVLAVASGHLREALFIKEKFNLEEFIALDQDPESLAVIAREINNINVNTTLGSIGDILKGKINLHDFDFIYATGLFDYLDEPTAILLTQCLFKKLKASGRLLIPNFVPHMEEIGYMEAFMNWWLIYRDQQDMQKIADALPQDQIESINLFIDTHQNILFLEIYKK